MLFGNIHQLDLLRYVDARIPQWIEQTLNIAKLNHEGRYELNDAGVFVMLSEVVTQALNERKAEVHKKYIDVQIVLRGEERIGYSLCLDEALKAQPHLENDIAFMDAVEYEQFVDLRAGDFAIFYPNVVHRPLCALEQTGKVRKAVLKIPAALF